MRWFTFEEGGSRSMTTLDWLIILAYFAGLGCLTWWVVSKNKDTRGGLLPGGPQSRLVDHRRLDLRLQHRLRAHRRPRRVGRQRTAWRWRTTSCTPGACWCSRWVFVPFYSRTLVFTMPEFLERRFSVARALRPARSSRSSRSSSRRSRSASSRAAWCSARCCPSVHVSLGPVTLDSFWIGSILVIVLTGLYTALGGMRAVAYNDTVQVFVLHHRLVPR